MSLHCPGEPDAASGMVEIALDDAAKQFGDCGAQIESLLILVVYKDDQGTPSASSHHEGSVFSSVGCAQAWLTDNPPLFTVRA